jgi:magnesium chelatase family protein
MFARIYSGSVLGVDAYRIEVEVDCSSGINQICVVGLPDAAIKEAQERVRSAIKSCAFLMPPGKKWIVNLAPADIRKEGPALDLPIAVGILASTGLLCRDHLQDFWIVGELSLDGSIRPVSGVLPIALAAKNANIKNIIVPDGNAEEAGLVQGLNVYPVSHLKQVCLILADPENGAPLANCAKEIFLKSQQAMQFDLDFADVKGQDNPKRALEIAAAGRHNILMVGPPGSGKSMLAQRLPSIMPPLSFNEAVELTKLYSVAGLLSSKKTLVAQRPFRSPHHSASSSGLVGGGSIPKPGEISLGHLGILFLDELTEFPRSHLECLRQPMETGNVTISRAQHTLTYPASFLLVGACNPCPCGHKADPIKYCVCSPAQASRYWARLSGPLLDRIDLQIQVSRLNEKELSRSERGQTSETMRLRIMRAVEAQQNRFEPGQLTFNAHLTNRQMQKYCQIDDRSRTTLSQAVANLGLSARAYDRIIRIARTIADLQGEDNIQTDHIAEAVQYRRLAVHSTL